MSSLQVYCQKCGCIKQIEITSVERIILERPALVPFSSKMIIYPCPDCEEIIATKTIPVELKEEE